mmetsp:Transcript_33814/g.52680  ORF Transcript_33814/g.52680 Transcript_33814/m.52680 type:complete len:249 (-) Transcript_33814:379-1125(-)
MFQDSQRHVLLSSIKSLHHPHLALCKVLRSQLEADGDALLLPMIVLPPCSVVLPRVNICTDASLLELIQDHLSLLIQRCPRVLEHDGDDDHLNRGYTRRKDETHVVCVDHHHHPNSPGGQTPRVLPRDRLLAFLILKLNLEHFSEILSEAMGGGTLDASGGGGNKGFHCRCVVSSSKLLNLGFLSLGHWHREKVLINPAIKVQDVQHLFARSLKSSMRRVALLPEEFAGTDEGGRILEFPSNYVAPLV